jgi:hypothetical protein
MKTLEARQIVQTEQALRKMRVHRWGRRHSVDDALFEEVGGQAWRRSRAVLMKRSLQLQQ